MSVHSSGGVADAQPPAHCCSPFRDKYRFQATPTEEICYPRWVPLAAALCRQWLRLELPVNSKSTGERRRTPVAHNPKLNS